jgi:hypothetical protein
MPVAVAEDNLMHGLDVVADTVNTIEVTRRLWTEAAESCKARLLNVEVTGHISRTSIQRRSKLCHHQRRSSAIIQLPLGRLPQLSLAVLGQGSEPCHRFRVADPEDDLATHFACQAKADGVIVHRR